MKEVPCLLCPSSMQWLMGGRSAQNKRLAAVAALLVISFYLMGREVSPREEHGQGQRKHHHRGRHVMTEEEEVAAAMAVEVGKTVTKSTRAPTTTTEPEVIRERNPFIVITK